MNHAQGGSVSFILDEVCSVDRNRVLADPHVSNCLTKRHFVNDGARFVIKETNTVLLVVLL